MTTPCLQEHRIQRIEQEVDAMSAQVNDLFGEVKVMHNNITQVIPMIREHDQTLKGVNGTPGMVALLAQIAEIVKDKQDDQKWFWRTVGAVVVSQALTFLIALLLK